MKLTYVVLVFSAMAANFGSFAQANPVRCELRNFCHDRGMPMAEDETSHFISVFLTETGSGVAQMRQVTTYDYGTAVPAVLWSPACESFKSQMEAFLRIDAKTECVEVSPDGSDVPSWH